LFFPFFLWASSLLHNKVEVEVVIFGSGRCCCWLHVPLCENEKVASPASRLDQYASVIKRIHGAIVAATGRSDSRGDRVCTTGYCRLDDHQLQCSIKQVFVAATIACSVYTGRLSRRRMPRRSPRQSPRVYTTGDRRGDKHLFNRATNRRQSQLGLRRGVFTCVWWQVTLCDPTWQVTFSTSKFDRSNYKKFNLNAQ